MIRLLLARHGNTFDKGEVVKRVGRKTDLPLSLSGQEQALRLGAFFLEKFPSLGAVYTSNLQRTIQTALLVQQAMGSNLVPTQHSFLDEIDYGPDEGQPEENVIARIGRESLRNWEQFGVVPDGWQVDSNQLQQGWFSFAKNLQTQHPNKTVLVITSNGVARFAPNHSVKLSTGAVSYIYVNGNSWELEFSNFRP